MTCMLLVPCISMLQRAAAAHRYPAINPIEGGERLLAYSG